MRLERNRNVLKKDSAWIPKVDTCRANLKEKPVLKKILNKQLSWYG